VKCGPVIFVGVVFVFPSFPELGDRQRIDRFIIVERPSAKMNQTKTERACRQEQQDQPACEVKPRVPRSSRGDGTRMSGGVRDSRYLDCNSRDYLEGRA
jgi:hypothetical protein